MRYIPLVIIKVQFTCQVIIGKLLSHRLISQSHSKLKFKSTNHSQSCNYVLCALALAFVFLSVALECLRLLCYFKVIPLKLFFYQTFFETWRN